VIFSDKGRIEAELLARKGTPMKKALLFLAASGILILTGCTSPDPAKKEGSTTDASTPEKKEVPIEVGSKLKHQAYEWMGLDRTEPFTLEMADVQGAPAAEGTQTLKIISSDDKTAKYQITRDGSMAKLGDEELEVREDGVYQTSMPQHTLAEPVMVMPADLGGGKSWTSKFNSTGPAGQKVEFTINNKAERIEKVKTKAGEFDSLLIISTGSMSVTADGKTEKTNLSTKSWYSKGLGNVKMTLEVKKADGTSNKVTVELVRAGTAPEPAPKP